MFYPAVDYLVIILLLAFLEIFFVAGVDKEYVVGLLTFLEYQDTYRNTC